MHDGPRLNAYDDGPLDVYLNCQASSYARMLQNRRLDPRILGDQWIYSYVRQPEAPYNSASFIHRNYPTVIRDWYGVEENVNHHDNANNALTYARQIIAEGALPAVYVDLFCYSRETFFSGRSHQPRSIILAGQRKDEFLVWDGMGVGRFVGWMPASDIATAMDSGHL